MADTSINFITTNPAMDAFQNGQKLAQQTLLNDAEIESRQRTNEEAKLSQGSRLRKIDADTDTAVAGADVAKATVPNKIYDAYNTSRTNNASADVAQGTVGAKIANENNSARTSGATADVAQAEVPDKIAQSNATTRTALSNAAVTEATEGNRITQSNDQTRGGTASADHIEMQNLDKTLALIKAGDVEGARLYNERSGAKAPPELFNNADVQKHVTDAWDKAKELYPDRPREQLAAMQGYLKHMAELKQSGQAPAKQDVFNIPGAPEPPEFSGKQNERQSAEIQKVEWLIKNKVAKTPQEAWTLAHQTLQNPNAVFSQIYNNHVRTNGGDHAKAMADTKAAVEMLRTLTPQAGSVAPPAPAPAAAAPKGAAPPLPTGVPPGSLYSPSRGLWRDPQGQLYGPDGTPAVERPQAPLSR